MGLQGPASGYRPSDWPYAFPESAPDGNLIIGCHADQWKGENYEHQTHWHQRAALDSSNVTGSWTYPATPPRPAAGAGTAPPRSVKFGDRDWSFQSTVYELLIYMITMETKQPVPMPRAALMNFS